MGSGASRPNESSAVRRDGTHETVDQLQSENQLLSWIYICSSNGEKQVPRAIGQHLQDRSFQIIMSDTSTERSTPNVVANASVVLFVIDPNFEEDKNVQSVFQSVTSSATPFLLIIAGPLRYRPRSSWLKQYFQTARDYLVFQNETGFDDNIELLVHQLTPQTITTTTTNNRSNQLSWDFPPCVTASDLTAIFTILNDATLVHEHAAAFRDLIDFLLSGVDAAVQILERKHIPEFLTALNQTVQDPDITLFGCWALMHLVASTHVQVCQAVFDVGAIEFLLRASLIHDTDVETQRVVLMSLEHLASAGYCINASQISRVTTAFATHPNDSEIQLHAGRLLSIVVASGDFYSVEHASHFDRALELMQISKKTFPETSLTGTAVRCCVDDLLDLQSA
eukprot:m.170015 g.170015  ORF g.170015 m.170015 type:complete len:395 (+) comp31601_c0_seq3:122-1306(+)